MTKYPLLIFLMLTFQLHSQVIEKIVPQFTFSNIDSLIESAFTRHYKSDIIAVKCDWDVGAQYRFTDTNFIAYRNPFKIYIFYQEEKNYYFECIDNFGYFLSVKASAKKLFQFIDSHLDEMRKEEIRAAADTTREIIDGKEVLRITSYTVDHQLSQRVRIAKDKTNLEYIFFESDTSNIFNLDTWQYRLLEEINQCVLKNRKKTKRANLVRQLVDLEESWRYY